MRLRLSVPAVAATLTGLAMLGAWPGSPALAAAADDAALRERLLEALDLACPNPQPPPVPNGSLAGRDDMIDGMRAAQALDAATNAYADCVRQREATLADELPPGGAERDVLASVARQLRNDEVERTTVLVARFNAQLRIFKTRPQDQVGRRYRPPQIVGKRELVGVCFPARISEAWITVTIQLDASGRVVGVVAPPGASTELVRSSECIARQVKFLPATRDGVPEAAEALLPINLGIDRGEKVTRAGFDSTPQDFVDATAACYPADWGAAGPTGDSVVRITVGSSGRVLRTRIGQSAGQPAVDEVAECIAQRMRFTPAQRDGRPVKSELTWTVRVRPPAAWEQGR